jgi:hypothetical protein
MKYISLVCISKLRLAVGFFQPTFSPKMNSNECRDKIAGKKQGRLFEVSTQLCLDKKVNQIFIMIPIKNHFFKRQFDKN